VVQTLGIVNGNRQIAQVFVPLTGVPGLNPPNPTLTSAKIFQTLFAQGLIQCTTPAAGAAACITAGNLAQFGNPLNNITNVGPPPPLSVVFSGQPDYRNPYSQQAEFGIEREIAPGFSVSGSYVYVHTLHLPVALDANNLPSAPITTAVSPFTGQQVAFRNWGAAQCAGNPLSCFANPLILQNNVYSSAASAVFHGGILEVKKRFSQHMTMLGSYTYSKAISNATDFNSDFGPMDQTNLAGERGLSDFDQRHKVVVAGVMDSPWKNAFFSGFQLAPIVKYNSGHPFNVLAGGTNINNDRHSTNDRPLGFGHNAGQGPDFFSLDVRLTKKLRVNERNSLLVTAEAFNLLNRTNFASVNNQYSVVNGFVNPNSKAFATGLAHPQGSFIDPITNSVGGAPGAFTSGAGSFARRQLQLGARWVF